MGHLSLTRMIDCLYQCENDKYLHLPRKAAQHTPRSPLSSPFRVVRSRLDIGLQFLGMARKQTRRPSNVRVRSRLVDGLDAQPTCEGARQ